jgi:hypothetical protein
MRQVIPLKVASKAAGSGGKNRDTLLHLALLLYSLTMVEKMGTTPS